MHSELQPQTYIDADRSQYVMDIGYVKSDGSQVITKPTYQGGIVAIYYLGTTIGTLMGGSVSDHIGRLRTVFIGCFFAIFGAALQVNLIFLLPYDTIRWLTHVLTPRRLAP